MAAKVGAVFVVDVLNDKNAVSEAKVLGIPVIAIVDTNVDPTNIDYPIPANDDAAKAVKLILSYIQSAIAEGQGTASKQAAEDKVEADKQAAEAEVKENLIKVAPSEVKGNG